MGLSGRHFFFDVVGVGGGRKKKGKRSDFWLFYKRFILRVFLFESSLSPKHLQAHLRDSSSESTGQYHPGFFSFELSL